MITPKKAIEKMLSLGISKYRIAKDLQVGAVMPYKWLSGEVKTMRSPVADRIKDIYDIEIDEMFINGKKDK